MFNWFKSFFSKQHLFSMLINDMDYLEPLLATQIDNAKASFNAMDSKAKAAWIIDQVQDFLRKRFGVSE